jgi:hypothetical protein
MKKRKKLESGSGRFNKCYFTVPRKYCIRIEGILQTIPMSCRTDYDMSLINNFTPTVEHFFNSIEEGIASRLNDFTGTLNEKT